MLAITRPHLAQWSLDPLDVAGIASAWLGWAQLGSTQTAAKYQLIWEARFEGFPEAQSAEWEARMRVDATAGGLPAHFVQIDGRETLVVRSFPVAALTETLLGPLEAWIAHPHLPHLTLRLTAESHGDRDATSATLTLFGGLLDGKFRVQSVWSGGFESNALFEHAPAPDESSLLENLQHYVAVDRHIADDRMPGARWSRIPCRYPLTSLAEATAVLANLRRLTGGNGGMVDGQTVSATATVAEMAQAVTEVRRPRSLVVPLSNGQEKSAYRILWLLFGDQRQRSLRDWGHRFGVAVVATGIGGMGWHGLSGFVAWVCLLLFVLGIVLLLWIPGYHAVLLRMYKTKMAQGLRETAYRPIGIFETSFVELGLNNDPAVQKHSSDVSALGGLLHTEIRLDGVKTMAAAARIYVFAEDHAVFSVMAMTGLPNQSIFPARVFFHLETRFTDGLRLVSTNQGSGFRKPVTPLYLPRFWPEAKNAREFLQAHRRVCQRLVREGRVVASLIPADILPRMEREHGQDREERDRRGWYTWSDAFHEVFNIIRPEYREP